VINVLALAGSLRAASINAAFCRAASRLAPPSVRISLFAGLGRLPPFNADLDSVPPHPVAELRTAVAASEALLLASPEYAHGIPGVMKNALDWLVSDEGVVAKPVAVVNTSPRAHHAYAALIEVLQTMSLTVVPAASVALPLLGGCTTEEQMIQDADVALKIRTALAALEHFVAAGAGEGPSFPVGGA
jgi:chromate reductase, NAD(P)H dehydrogenase (quinone)